MRTLLIVFALLLTSALQAKEQIPAAVWGKGCFHLEQDAYVWAPLKNGHPDMKNVRVVGVTVTMACYTNTILKGK